MGRNVQRMLKFAIEYPTWHTYGKDRATVSALRTLENAGLIVRNEHRQFRLALTEHWAKAIDKVN